MPAEILRIGSSNRRVLNQSTHASVANSTASMLLVNEQTDAFRRGHCRIAATADRHLAMPASTPLGVAHRQVLAVMHQHGLFKRTDRRDTRQPTMRRASR